jgi:hypothetical protein
MADPETTIHNIRGLRIAVTQLNDGTYGVRLKFGSTSYAALVGPMGEVASLSHGSAGEGHEFEPTEWLPEEVFRAMRDAVRARRLSGPKGKDAD